ncbi:putative transporter-like protein 3 [Podospora aff. communis PSN243]|uniref:Transporter-like protein 3 n=1 Tax=Podospora aff. communis PSN243 TaxID=3040156 RepID=A0AAV9H3E3_9PEZI|nr:putative transporter-like protein 3 [Podospora aff. communis PSN243]
MAEGVDAVQQRRGGLQRPQQRQQGSGDFAQRRLQEGEVSEAFWDNSSEEEEVKTSERMTPESEERSEGEVMDGEGEAYELEERGLLQGGGKDGGFDEDAVDGVDGVRRRRRRGSVASFQLYTPDEERAVVRKFDRRLVVFVALLYMLSFLDRSNIGNARVAGMDDDLQGDRKDGGWYEWALTAFYITYIGFEWMTLLWRVIPPHIYISVLVMSWGLTASLQAVAVNYPMLIALRALLGIGEAGFTGVPFYLTFFFKRHELAFRTAIFISAAPLATTFASSLAWLIMKVGQNGPIAPWRLLFLVEGFPSVLAAAFAWTIIPDSPETTSYLTPRQRKIARLRLRHEQPSSNPKKPTHNPNNLSLRAVLSVLTSPIAWLTAAIFFLTNMAVSPSPPLTLKLFKLTPLWYSSLPVFLPTILTSMGHSPLLSQALSAPPYLTSFLILLTTAYASDASRSRSPYLIASALLSSSGYAFLALTSRYLPPGHTLRYLAVYPAAVGFFNVVVLTVSWSLNNQQGAARQGGGFALMQVVGQCGPLVGTRLYPDGEGPYYERGMAVCAVAMGVVAVLGWVLRGYLGRLNRRLVEEEEDGDGQRGERFRYML